MVRSRSKNTPGLTPICDPLVPVLTGLGLESFAVSRRGFCNNAVQTALKFAPFSQNFLPHPPTPRGGFKIFFVDAPPPFCAEGVWRDRRRSCSAGLRDNGYGRRRRDKRRGHF